MRGPLAQHCHIIWLKPADGGCSRPAWPVALTTPRKTSRDRLCIAVLASTLACSSLLSPGIPSIYSEFRSAFGPGRLSLRRENSLHGGALHTMPTRPECARRSSRCRTLSSNMSWVSCSAKSKGPKQSRPLLSIALVRGECTPAKRSRNRRGGCLAVGAGASPCLRLALARQRPVGQPRRGLLLPVVVRLERHRQVLFAWRRRCPLQTRLRC